MVGADPEVLAREKLREDALREAGVRTVRFVRADLDAEGLTFARMRRALPGEVAVRPRPALLAPVRA